MKKLIFNNSGLDSYTQNMLHSEYKKHYEIYKKDYSTHIASIMAADKSIGHLDVQIVKAEKEIIIEKISDKMSHYILNHKEYI